jgi:uncharacterized protein YdcH (DUF465 family)
MEDTINTYKILVEKINYLKRIKPRLKDNIKTILKEMICEGVGLTHLAR